MWGSKKIFARFVRQFLLKHSAAYAEGMEERRDAGEGKGRRNAKTNFFLLHTQILSTHLERRGSLGNCSTPSSREISFSPQNSLNTLGSRIPSHTGCGRFEARYGKVITSVCFPHWFQPQIPPSIMSSVQRN